MEGIRRELIIETYELEHCPVEATLLFTGGFPMRLIKIMFSNYLSWLLQGSPLIVWPLW